MKEMRMSRVILVVLAFALGPGCGEGKRDAASKDVSTSVAPPIPANAPSTVTVMDASSPAIMDAAHVAEQDAAVAAEPKPMGETPSLTRSPRRICRKNSDCVLLPTRPCSCPPCGDQPREAMNRKAAKKLQSAWAKRRCVQPACKPCEGRYVGEKAVCEQRQCVVR